MRECKGGKGRRKCIRAAKSALGERELAFSGFGLHYLIALLGC